MTSTRFFALQWLALALLFAGLLYVLGPILMPFLAAAILSYICQPWITRLSTLGLSRTAATLIVMSGLAALFVLLVLILLPLLGSELDLLLQKLPDLLEALQTRLLPYLQQQLGTEIHLDAITVKALLREHFQTAGNVAGRLLPWLTGGSAVLLGLLMNIILIPLAMFYLLRDWPALMSRIDALIPRHWYEKTQEIVREVDHVLSQFMRGQLSVMLLMSVFYAAALWLTGLQFALPIGIVSGFLVFIPYFGMAVGLGLATLVGFSQFELWQDVLWVWLVFGLGQLLEGMVITPKLVGDRIGLHPLAVIFALLAFGQLFGFFGVLLALPAAAVLLVCARHFKDWYLNSHLYQD